jgi:hypothetical protein
MEACGEPILFGGGAFIPNGDGRGVNVEFEEDE